MKKFLWVCVFLPIGNCAQAQLADTLGTLAVDGTLTGGAFNGVNQMNAALGRMQFQQDVAALAAEIQTTFMGNYQSVDKDLLGFYGLKNVQWNVHPLSDFEFYIELQNVSAENCYVSKNNGWNAKRVEINNGNGCQAQNNQIKLYFD